MNSLVLMMQYISRTALIHSACVYPVIFTACARLQKKTSVCFLTDVTKMNDANKQQKRPILHETVPFPLSFSTFGDV